jgi:hypothetical protein
MLRIPGYYLFILYCLAIRKILQLLCNKNIYNVHIPVILRRNDNSFKLKIKNPTNSLKF